MSAQPSLITISFSVETHSYPKHTKRDAMASGRYVNTRTRMSPARNTGSPTSSFVSFCFDRGRPGGGGRERFPNFPPPPCFIRLLLQAAFLFHLFRCIQGYSEAKNAYFVLETQDPHIPNSTFEAANWSVWFDVRVSSIQTSRVFFFQRSRNFLLFYILRFLYCI